VRSASTSFSSIRRSVSASRHTQSVRYRLGMETRSRSKVRATNSPPREVTVGGTQPETEVVLGLPLSATGQSGDGIISPRSSSLEAGPRRTYRPTTRSESVGQTRGPAQGVIGAVDQGAPSLEDSWKAPETATDTGQISTYINKTPETPLYQTHC